MNPPDLTEATTLANQLIIDANALITANGTDTTGLTSAGLIPTLTTDLKALSDCLDGLIQNNTTTPTQLIDQPADSSN